MSSKDLISTWIVQLPSLWLSQYCKKLADKLTKLGVSSTVRAKFESINPNDWRSFEENTATIISLRLMALFLLHEHTFTLKDIFPTEKGPQAALGRVLEVPSQFKTKVADKQFLLSAATTIQLPEYFTPGTVFQNALRETVVGLWTVLKNSEDERYTFVCVQCKHSKKKEANVLRSRWIAFARLEFNFVWHQLMADRIEQFTTAFVLITNRPIEVRDT